MAGGGRFRSGLRWRGGHDRTGGRTPAEERRAARLPVWDRRGLCGTGGNPCESVQGCGRKGVALAGAPREFERAWRAAGVDEFIFAGADAVTALEALYCHIGVETKVRAR